MERDMSDKTTRITRGSTNVFADLGLPDADERLFKARIAAVIGERITELNLTQSAAALKLGISQPDISNIVRGRLKGFTLERLLVYLRALGNDLEVKVTPAKNPNRAGRILMRA
jgi:predicted XRE-type DNA-binding protein